MKKLLFISAMALMCAGGLQAQNLKDTIYFDEDWKVVGSTSDAVSFFRLYDGSDKSEGRKPFKDFLTTASIRNTTARPATTIPPPTPQSSSSRNP